MKRATLTLLVLVVTIASTPAVELSHRGYAVSRERREDGMTLYDVRDDGGNALTVGTASGSFSNENMNVLEILRETFFNMEYLTISRMKVLFSRNQTEVVVIPRRYSYDGIDLARLMPSGMRFFYTDLLSYDFRMLIDGLSVQMEGHYFTEQQFLDRLARAARNPAAYVQSSDPRYLFDRLDELSQRIVRVENSGVEMSGEVESLLASFLEFRVDASQGIRRLERDFRREMARMQLACEELQEEQAQLQRELARTRRALLVFENRGWLGALRVPDQEVVSEIVALKLANPQMRIDEAESVINEGRDEAVSNRLVTLVFSLYFNEFE